MFPLRPLVTPRRPSSSRTKRGISFFLSSWFLEMEDRKSTRLNSSHVSISYAVFCLKKKNRTRYLYQTSGLQPLGRLIFGSGKARSELCSCSRLTWFNLLANFSFLPINSLPHRERAR